MLLAAIERRCHASGLFGSESNAPLIALPARVACPLARHIFAKKIAMEMSVGLRFIASVAIVIALSGLPPCSKVNASSARIIGSSAETCLARTNQSTAALWFFLSLSSIPKMRNNVKSFGFALRSCRYIFSA